MARLSIDQPIPHGLHKESGGGIDIEFAHQVCSMTINRFWTDAQMIGDTAVGQAPGDTVQDFDFASGKVICAAGTGQNLLGAGANNPASGCDVPQPVAQFLNRRRFEKNTLRTAIHKLLQGPGRGTARDDGDPGLRAPSLRFDHHFKTGRTGHDQVEQSTVGSVFLDGSDRLDAVGDHADNLEVEHVLDGRTCALGCQCMVIGDQNGSRHSAGMLATIVALVTALFLMFTQTLPGLASERQFDITGPMDVDSVGAQIEFLFDDDHSLTVADMLGDEAGNFRPLETSVADFGYTNSMIWLRLVMHNASEDTVDWRLYFHENFKQIFHVYLVDKDGKVDHALALDLDSPFSHRAVAFPEVVVPFAVPPGDDVTVYVQFWTEGSTNLALSIETVESFTDIAATKTAKNFIFYGMMVVMILFALLAMAVLRLAVFPAYIAYTLSTLLYMMHSDGAAFQYIWSNYPAFNSFASVVFGAGYIVFGSIFARLFLNTRKYHPWVDKVLLATIVGTLLLVLSSAVIDTSIVKKYLVLIALWSVSLFTVSGLIAARKRFREVRFYVLAWFGAAISAGLMFGRHWLGVDVSQDFQYDSMRAVMVVDSMLMGMAIIDRYNQLRKRHQMTLHSSLEHAQRNLALAKRLRDLETRYDQAIDSSARRDRQLKNTVHDLRQPLHALRLAVHGAIREEPDKDTSYSDINDSFNYLERLVTEHLNQPAAPLGHHDTEEPNEVSDMPLNDILRSVYEMFLPDAEAKGLSFTYVPTSSHVHIEPLAVMRMVTNLVSNAIKYTETGKVLLGVRRGSDGISIQVHDTGSGLTEQSFAEARKRTSRLTTSESGPEGHGLGLDIVSELAERHGYRLRLLPGRIGGTGIAVEVADPQNPVGGKIAGSDRSLADFASAGQPSGS